MTKKEIITRVLNNLKAIYLHGEDHRQALAVVDRLIFLNPGEPQEIRDRGLLRYQLDDLSGALSDLERYVTYCPTLPTRRV